MTQISSSEIKALKNMVNEMEQSILSFKGRSIQKMEGNDKAQHLKEITKELRKLLPSFKFFWEKGFSDKYIIRKLSHLTKAIENTENNILDLNKEDREEKEFYKNLLVKMNNFVDRLQSNISPANNYKANKRVFNAIVNINEIYRKNFEIATPLLLSIDHVSRESISKTDQPLSTEKTNLKVSSKKHQKKRDIKSLLSSENFQLGCVVIAAVAVPIFIEIHHYYNPCRPSVMGTMRYLGHTLSRLFV